MGKNRPNVADHSATYPVAPKVKAATTGAGAGAALGTFLIWIVDQVWWNGDAAPEVSFPVQGMILTVSAAVVTFVSGYSARHQKRV